MNDYLLERQQFIPRPLDEVFAFFSKPDNLEKLTPPRMHFRIVTPLAQMVDGARIDYRLRLAGIPVRWRSLISVWDPPRHFADVQEKGPYAQWDHHHYFQPLGDGVLMTDRVRYRMRLGVLGRLLHWGWARRSLSAVFDYRYHQVEKIFGSLQ